MNNGKHNRMSISLALAALLLASLACSLPGTIVSTPAPQETIPVSTEAVATMEQNVEAAVATATATGKLTVELTQEQVTSAIALEMQKQAEPILTEPQVYFQNGQIEVRGNVHQNGLNAPIQMFVTAAVSGGKLVYTVTSAKIGPLPVPDSMLSQFSDQINASLGSMLDPQTTNMAIETLTIENGKMILTGSAL